MIKKEFIRLPINSPRRSIITVDNLCKKCIYLDSFHIDHCEKQRQERYTTTDNYICIIRCDGFQEEQKTIADIGDWILCQYPIES